MTMLGGFDFKTANILPTIYENGVINDMYGRERLISKDKNSKFKFYFHFSSNSNFKLCFF